MFPWLQVVRPGDLPLWDRPHLGLGDLPLLAQPLLRVYKRLHLAAEENSDLDAFESRPGCAVGTSSALTSALWLFRLFDVMFKNVNSFRLLVCE